MHDDDQLMMAYRAGDVRAYEALVNRYRRMVFGFLRRMLKNDALAEDVLLETFFKVHRSAEAYEPRGQFKTFLFRIAYHLGLNALRDGAKWQGYSTLEDSAGLPTGAMEPSEGSRDPEALLIQQQSITSLNRALMTLPEVQRSVFLLYYREGLETPAISEVVGIPAGSVRAYLSMARKTLREALAEPGASARG